jgi:hypothetical protein
MLLIVANYENELQIEKFSNYDFIDVKFFNEKKWSVFWYKLQKFLYENKWKYDFVLHFGLCWWHYKNQIWEIYKIDRSFLYYNDIIENQRFRFWDFKFNNILNNNIVSKFNVWKHDDKLYDFADIYDIETFWVAQLSNIISVPIMSIKWVSDINDLTIITLDDENEIEFLLSPDMKRKRQKFIDILWENINKINDNLINFFDNEFIDFYLKFSTNSKFRKEILCWN